MILSTRHLKRIKPFVLDQPMAAGLDVTYMSIYLRDKERWSLELARDYNARLARELGLAETGRSETSSVVHYSYKYKGMTVRSACIDFGKNGSNRGGLLEQYSDQPRNGPCRKPFETFVVDFTGHVMPCCNLLSDKPASRPTRREHRVHRFASRPEACSAELLRSSPGATGGLARLDH